MWMAWVGIVVWLAACGTDPASHVAPRSPEPSSSSSLDRLWSLAPRDADLGLVIGGDALVLVDRLASIYAEAAAAVPQGQLVASRIDQLRVALKGAASSYADAGVALERGAAVFRTPLGVVAVLPVADRARFVAAHGATRAGDADQIGEITCRDQRGAYACAPRAAALDGLGMGDLATHVGVDGHRGNIELVVRVAAADARVPGLIDITAPLAVIAQLEPGELIVRGRLPGTVLGPLATLIGAPPAHVDLRGASGFVVAPLEPFSRAVVHPGARALLASFATPISIVIATGAEDVEGRATLRDPGPMRAALERCADIPMVPGVVVGGTCRLGPIDRLPFAVSVDAWVDDDVLQFAHRRGPPPVRGGGDAVSAVGRELVGYSIAAWGRGVIAPGDVAGAGAPAFAALSELGFGASCTADGLTGLLVVRTVHANPDEVAAKLAAAIADGGDVVAAVAKIAEAHPLAPIAADVAAGPLALTVPFLGLGVVTAIGIPALLEQARGAAARTRPGPDRIDAGPERILEVAGRNARLHYATHGSFPVGAAGWTPSPPCCKQPGGVCVADRVQFANDPIWRTLGVSVDEAQRFGFLYSGHSYKFTLKAEADLDCDGRSFTKVWLQGRVENGGPVVTLSRTEE